MTYDGLGQKGLGRLGEVRRWGRYMWVQGVTSPGMGPGLGTGEEETDTRLANALPPHP